MIIDETKFLKSMTEVINTVEDSFFEIADNFAKTLGKIILEDKGKNKKEIQAFIKAVKILSPIVNDKLIDIINKISGTTIYIVESEEVYD